MLTNLPNLLTLSRILVIPVILILLTIPGGWAAWTALGLFAVAGITDWFDGYLARSRQQESRIGRFLDPIADKLLIVAVLFVLGATQHDMPMLPALVILLREVLVSGLREFLAGMRVDVPVSRTAKWKTAVQMVAIGFLIVGPHGPDFLPVQWIGDATLWAAAALSVLTGWDYLRVGLAHMLPNS